MSPARILIEGRPGSGKSTVAASLAELLRQRRFAVSGFVTHELRERGRRVGFAVETFDGRSATLAHVELSGPPRVGKYGVDLAAFERVALPSLDRAAASAVVVVDELGKMELASDAFRQAVSSLFSNRVDVVATVHVFGHELTDALKRRADVEVVRLTRASRDELPQRLAERLARSRRR